MHLNVHQYNRQAFTMIELVFIIVITAILASIAISKMAGTRDDAKLSADVSNMAICLRDANAYFLAKTEHLPASDSEACKAVICYDITYGTTHDSNFTIELNTTAEDYCEDIDNVGGHLVGDYQFSGNTIER